MKIGIEVQRLFRKERFGIETSALELIHELYKLNTKHTLVVLTKKGANHNLFKGCEEFNFRQVGGKLFIDFEQIFLPIAARNEKLDILHCTGNTTPIYCPVPIVQTLHDIIFMDPIPKTDSLYQRFGNYYRRFIVPIVSKKSKAIITVSQHEKNRIIERLKIPENRIHVIHNGINSRFKKNDDKRILESFTKKYNLPERYILFIGNSSHRKNPERVLKAYVKYYSKKKADALALVTPGLSRNYVNEYLKIINEEHAQNHIYTPGYVDSDDLPLLYSCSTLFLFPSLSEGFGMPVLEAMACGVPVITSNLSSIPEIAGNAAKLIDPYNTEAITSAIEDLLENPTLMYSLGERGIQQAEKFRWAKVAEKTMEIYEQVYFTSSSHPLKGVTNDLSIQ
ncbi:MAG: glycosyltransferase family 1 protein [Cyclobacteriaceae bacterium]|nr:MAG: glycosyltransferase family 1 protein [Cyclobacteriaceae bacterium]